MSASRRPTVSAAEGRRVTVTARVGGVPEMSPMDALWRTRVGEFAFACRHESGWLGRSDGGGTTLSKEKGRCPRSCAGRKWMIRDWATRP